MISQVNDDQPIFQQITDYIQNEIVEGRLKEGDRVPSTNELARTYHINPATAAKGIKILVDKNVIYKKRGVGMFVSPEARRKLMQERNEKFYAQYMDPLIEEANRIQMSTEEIILYIKVRKKN